ncbi:MAG: FadR family transcriptional regulator [Phycisphaerae bacterium]|nr:FadR family transcriptional regulator [Phycisphaerae bacterium]
MINLPASSTADRIRAYIRKNRLKPGDKLPVHADLAAKLGIGPRRLREALSILEYQGFIETRNKAGTIVRRPSVERLGEPIAWHLDASGYKLEDLIRARAWIEGGAAAEAAERRIARDLLLILDALEQLEARASSGQSDLAEEKAFHLAVLHATRNPVIATFGQLVTLQFEYVDATPPPRRRRDLSNREHRQIYEAIERRDANAARSLMVAHVLTQLGRRKKR